MISNLMAHYSPQNGDLAILVTSLTPPTSDAVPGPSPLVNWMIHWSENLVWWSRSRRSAPAQAAPEPGRGWGPGHQGSDSGHVNTVHSGHTPHTRSLTTKSQHPASSHPCVQWTGSVPCIVQACCTLLQWAVYTNIHFRRNSNTRNLR